MKLFYLTLAALVLAGVALASTSAQAIQIGPGVVCLTDVGVQYRFQNTLHFSNIALGEDHLKLDTTDLLFAYNGTYLANITAVNFVDLTTSTRFIVEWHGTSDNTTTSWFNVTGLTPGVEYQFLVDGLNIVNHTADTTGTVHFEWLNADTSPHLFDILTSYASISSTDWTLILLIIFFIILLVLGFVVSWFHILCGIEGFLLAYDIWLVTANDGLTVLVAGFALLILILGMFRKMDL